MQVILNRHLTKLPDRLYKYIDFPGAIKVLSNKTLKFANPSSWADNTDPYETKVVNGMYEIKDHVSIDYPLKDNVFVACFTEQYSCEAQWKSYQQKKSEYPCVEFQFNTQKLIKAIEQTDAMLMYGKVEYYETCDFKNAIENCFSSQVAQKALLNYTKYPTQNNLKYVLRPLLIKRIAYAYENEWRFMLTGADIYDSNAIVFVPQILDALEVIIIGPCKDNTQFNNAKQEILKALHNRNIPVRESFLKRQAKKATSFSIK